MFEAGGRVNLDDVCAVPRGGAARKRPSGTPHMGVCVEFHGKRAGLCPRPVYGACKLCELGYFMCVVACAASGAHGMIHAKCWEHTGAGGAAEEDALW